MLHFSKHLFGKKHAVQVAFKAGSFDQWNWLHFGELGGIVFCHVCAKSEEEGKLKAFIQQRFSNWKDATERFHHHE